jgi:nicotinate-nucleotide adenylyltransferase
MRIGLFGGTFDPPHTGHLIVASDAFEQLELDRLILIPSADPPHKRGKVHGSSRERLEMVRAAVRDDPRFEVDDLELDREGASYSVDTLRQMRTRHPDAELFFLVGADQMRELQSWREPEEVARLACLSVLTRDGERAPQDTPFRHRVVPVTRIDLSATDIRRRVGEGRSIRYLVPEGVRELIEEFGLYRG